MRLVRGEEEALRGKTRRRNECPWRMSAPVRVLSRFKRRNAERWWRGAGAAEEAQRAGQEGGAAPSHDHQYAHNVSPD